MRRSRWRRADSYKDSEVSDFADRAQIPWPIEFRRVGAGKDGGADIRGFQRLVHGKKLQMIENLSLSTAISKSAIRRDGNGNPGLQKAHANGRIDVLSAAVIAAGLAEPHFDRAARPAWRYAGIMRPPRPYRTAKRRWARVRAGVLERDGHRCRACGRASWPLEVDHVKRIASGGSAWAEMNLQTLCGRCPLDQDTRGKQNGYSGGVRVACPWLHQSLEGEI